MQKNVEVPILQLQKIVPKQTFELQNKLPFRKLNISDISTKSKRILDFLFKVILIRNKILMVSWLLDMNDRNIFNAKEN